MNENDDTLLTRARHQFELAYPKTHDIDQLISIANRNHVTIPLTEYIDDHAGTLSVWEARTRYVMNLRIEKRKIEKALPEIDKYLSECEKEFGNYGD